MLLQAGALLFEWCAVVGLRRVRRSRSRLLRESVAIIIDSLRRLRSRRRRGVHCVLVSKNGALRAHLDEDGPKRDGVEASIDVVIEHDLK